MVWRGGAAEHILFPRLKPYDGGGEAPTATLELYNELAEFASGGTRGDLPDVTPNAQRLLDLFPLWVFWQATGKRFLPSQLERESLEQLSGFLQLDGMLDTMRKTLEREEKDEDDDG
jgi:hypothetical protein